MAKKPREPIASLIDCYVQLAPDQWRDCYYVSDESHPEKSEFDPVANISLRRIPISPAPPRKGEKALPPIMYRLTVFGTDSTMIGNWYESESLAMEIVVALLKSAPLTRARCEELGLNYD